MLGCLCKGIFREEGATHCKMEKLEIRAFIKYFCRKGMHFKENHKDFMETLREESSFYSTMKKKFNRGERESVEDDVRSGRPKDASTDENVKVVHTLVMCDRRRDLRSIASEVIISFGAEQSILTNILGMSTVSARGVSQLLTDDQGLIFLGIPCLAMKMIPVISSSEL